MVSVLFNVTHYVSIPLHSRSGDRSYRLASVHSTKNQAQSYNSDQRMLTDLN